MQISDAERLVLLMDEIRIAKTKLQPHDTGHIHTSISYLESRVEEIQQDIEKVLKKAAYGV
tara:strand:+ start:451 stop:633 length:183 start_codon:yes stop_codon:yes gene_type:complete